MEIWVGVNFGRMMSYEQTATSAGLVTVHLRLGDIRFPLHYREKVKQPLATRQAAELLGYRVAAIDQIGNSHFSLRFDVPVQSSRNLVGGNSAAPPKGWQISG
jgi:hypothetical protein